MPSSDVLHFVLMFLSPGAITVSCPSSTSLCKPWPDQQSPHLVGNDARNLWRERGGGEREWEREGGERGLEFSVCVCVHEPLTASQKSQKIFERKEKPCNKAVRMMKSITYLCVHMCEREREGEGEGEGESTYSAM